MCSDGDYIQQTVALIKNKGVQAVQSGLVIQGAEVIQKTTWGRDQYVQPSAVEQRIFL